MTRLKKEDMGKYGCNFCRYYREAWTCSLEECFLVTEERQARKKRQPVKPQVKWEVIF